MFGSSPTVSDRLSPALLFKCVPTRGIRYEGIYHSRYEGVYHSRWLALVLKLQLYFAFVSCYADIDYRNSPACLFHWCMIFVFCLATIICFLKCMEIILHSQVKLGAIQKWRQMVIYQFDFHNLAILILIKPPCLEDSAVLCSNAA